MTPEPILIDRDPLITRTEVTRSFGYKLSPAQYGGPDYESRDFFASQKAECRIEDAERVSEQLYEFCRKEVLKAVGQYIADMRQQRKTKTTEITSTAERRSA
jgi:hypothetical protein